MTLHIRHAALAAPIALVLATPAFAQTRHFDIAAQPAASGVAQFGMQAGLQIVAPAARLRGKSVHAVTGTMSPEAALTRLLDGTGLRVKRWTGTIVSLTDDPAPRPRPRRVASAQTRPAVAAEASPDASSADIVVSGNRTRSITELKRDEIQKILPGVSPLRALQTLPGVTFTSADPWGNNEQNTVLFIHGFNGQQLGYTLDGVPLGDQQYGSFNGLSPQRAVISENVGRVTLATGAGDLGTASTSNLGGTIDVFSADPATAAGGMVQQTLGSYGTSRSYARLDSGTFGDNNRLYVSGVRQRARAWDFDGVQSGWQANGKFVHEGATTKLTLYGAYSTKKEPNEDLVVRTLFDTAEPRYTNPSFYPDFKGMMNYINSPAYAADGANTRNYYSAAHRTDYLAYAKYEWQVDDHVRLTVQPYFHHNDGVGIVAGPITVAGLPRLFSYYYPATTTETAAQTLARLNGIAGGSGLATRTTEYRINRGGAILTLNADLGDHRIEFGGWYERLGHDATRRWYGLDVNAPTTPYEVPIDVAPPLITQYQGHVTADVMQAHLQDSWHVTSRLTVQAGFKSAFQNARQSVPVQPIPNSVAGTLALPVGRVNTARGFLPQVGVLWQATDHEELFANVQQNIRQFQITPTSSISPFGLGSQAAFDLFKNGTKPETSWTYEAGLRVHRPLHLGPVTGFDGQLNVYHVDFQNRLLAISPSLSTVAALVQTSAIIQNVGSVKTDGVDVAGTLRFGLHVSLYNALSYNVSQFQNDYLDGGMTIATAGKDVPGSPRWMNKTMVTLEAGDFDAQLIGDYLGKRYGTYTNDLWADGYYTLSARIGGHFPLTDQLRGKTLDLSLNVTNLTNQKGVATLIPVLASFVQLQFPLAPRQVFVTAGVRF